MLNLLMLTPVHGDDRRVQGGCVGRGRGSIFSRRAGQATPSSPALLLPPLVLLGDPAPF